MAVYHEWSKKWEMSRKNLIIIAVFTLLSLLWCFAPVLIARCEAAAPKEIVISEQELTRLEAELNTALTAIQNCKSNSEMLAAQLSKSKEALAQAQAQLAKLKTQLEQSQMTLIEQKQQLETVNQSLTALSAEMRKERRKLERQRNIAYLITALSIYAAAQQ